jgi:hypothetical protein
LKLVVLFTNVVERLSEKSEWVTNWCPAR